MFKKMFQSNQGMSLIEIMVVVAIIAGITGLIAVNVSGRREQANIKLTQTQIANIVGALDQYKLDNYRYPSTEQGLDALVDKPTSGKVPENYPEEGYLKKIPRDSWGNDFGYASPGTHGDAVEVWSPGPDGEEGNEDDIVSWEANDEES